MTAVITFTERQLQRTVDVMNAYAHLLQLVEIGFGVELISFSLPFSGGALLLQIFANDTADVTVVGEPPREACEQMAMLCAAIGTTWRAEGWPTSSLEGACGDLESLAPAAMRQE